MATLNPYLHFLSNAREAIEFYHQVFGGELVLNTFGESGMASDPSEADKVMHAQITTPSGFTLMASDTPSHIEGREGAQIDISLSGPLSDDAELRGYWAALLEGGEEQQPLVTAPWGASFGMLVDRFGIGWMVNIAAE